MAKGIGWVAGFGFALPALVAGAYAAQSPSAGAERLFAARVWPLLSEKCLACHGKGEGKPQGGLDLRSRAGALSAGLRGKPSLVPGKPEASPLLLSVTRRHTPHWPAMPPKENDRLNGEQVAWIRQWIAAGAPWPDARRRAELLDAGGKWAASGGVPARTSGGLSPEWTNRKYRKEDLWVYQPLKRPAVPRGPGNPIDAFIERRLAALKLEPAPRADRRTLIRRVTYDLTGLPPTPAEIEAYVRDPGPEAQAWAKVVDRLLASPHYGERWARHWLDVARYADTSGFANDYERGNAWRYRDYVIRSFNQDKPYDRFIREQIAGDEIDARDPELLVATGFLRMGPWELTGMEVARVARQRFLDDVTDSVGQVFLGHPLQCARCHDHKFDPVPTRDYYRIQAAFATTQLAERDAPFLPWENRAGFEERRLLERKRQDHLAVLRELDAKSLAAVPGWYAERKISPAAWEKTLAEVRSQPDRGGTRTLFAEVRSTLQRRGVPDEQLPPRHLGFEVRDFGIERIARKGLERLRWEMERYEPYALSVYSGRTPDLRSVNAPLRVPAGAGSQGELEQTAILAGGDPFSPTQKVEPGVLSAADGFVVTGSALPTAVEGRRRALAEWIAHPRNPLTARVIVNRVWGWHFGQALAGNPNNLGATGKKPTHPELLDYLASAFCNQGWKLKALHRLILTSETYRRSTSHPNAAGLAARDPGGTSYAAFRPRRLTAEELRDSMLAVSGELNRQVGGIPARPEINPEAALQPRQVMGTFASAWEPSARPEQRHRRSIYVLKVRGLRDPFLEVFNEPSPDLSSEGREASTVTPQVFSLFNGRNTHDRALALAARLREAGGPPEPVIRAAFEQCLGRSPTPPETAAALAHWRAMTARHRTLPVPEPAYPREVEREAVEENTGEKFRFVERLHVFDEFVPDLKPSAVDAETRGLAEVCLALFNANEFLYIY